MNVIKGRCSRGENGGHHYIDTYENTLPSLRVG